MQGANTMLIDRLSMSSGPVSLVLGKPIHRIKLLCILHHETVSSDLRKDRSRTDRQVVLITVNDRRRRDLVSTETVAVDQQVIDGLAAC